MPIVYISVGIMVVLAVLFGVVLALASKRFAVHMDPRAEQVHAVLPHIDCGICVKESKQSGAVELVDNLPVIDYSKWTEPEQRACLEKCPMSTYWRQEELAEAVAPLVEQATRS